MKKQSFLARLFEYAGAFKYLTPYMMLSSWALFDVSALPALMQFIYTEQFKDTEFDPMFSRWRAY